MTTQVYNLDGPKEFPFPYPVRAAAQLTVEIVPGNVVSPGDYEVVGVGPTSTQVTVRYPNAPTTGGLQLKISRYVAPERVTVIDDPSDITTVNLNAEFNNIYEALIDFEEFILNLVQQMLDDFEANVLDPALAEITQARDDAVAAKDAAEDAQQGAEQAEQGATAAWDAFRDRYWGAFPSDPSVSPIGNPPTAGDLYWNTTVGQWRVWDAGAGAWVSATSSVPAHYDRRNYVATEGQTTFEATYDAGFVQVWVNGLLLPPDDYEASTGTEIVLDEGLVAGTEVTVVGLGAVVVGVLDGNDAMVTTSTGTQLLPAALDGRVVHVPNITALLALTPLQDGQVVEVADSDMFVWNAGSQVWSQRPAASTIVSKANSTQAALIRDGLNVSGVDVVYHTNGFQFLVPEGTTGTLDGSIAIDSTGATLGLQGGGSIKVVAYGVRLAGGVLKTPLNAPTNHLLFQSNAPGPMRMHMEPNGVVEDGTVSKLDWMLDPYDGGPTVPYNDENQSYRIFNVFTKTGEAAGLNGENGAACVGTKNRADGNTWGVFTSVHYGFNDCAYTWGKAYFFDTSDSEWRTPQKNFWYEGKSINSGDYLLYGGVLYQAQATGTCGSTPPTHTAGTVSDGNIDFTFIRDYKLQTAFMRPVMMFGNRDDMPEFGFSTVGVQYKTDTLHAYGNLQRFSNSAGSQIGYIGLPDGSPHLQIRGPSRGVRFGDNGVVPLEDNTTILGASTVRFSKTYSREFRPGTGTPIWTSGNGGPEGVVAAPVGSLFTDAGAVSPDPVLYVKESGTGNTGWVAK